MIIGEAGQAVQAVWGDLLGNSGHVYGGGGKGGQFKMDPEELASVIGLWEDELDKIVEDGRTIETMSATAVPPGQDPVSGTFVSTARDSIASLQQQNESMLKYVQSYIKKLKAAQQKTVVTDESMSETFRQAT
ncbi:hypothetical protein [Amycolatopsis kentuckyensis]|uniref:hypothetical protein n=1 Tax=Amycolatopsis kentuckyensis TaxID=218823 RepID=UPI0035639602